jgi:hypothetical protein
MAGGLCSTLCVRQRIDLVGFSLRAASTLLVLATQETTLE